MEKSYDSWRQEQGTPEPFVVGGETFSPRAKLSWKTQVRLDKALDKLSGEEPDVDTAVREFFTITLRKQDRERFFATIDAGGDDDDDDDENVVDFAQLFKIMSDLMELYRGKAPTSAESSTPGQ